MLVVRWKSSVGQGDDNWYACLCLCLCTHSLTYKYLALTAQGALTSFMLHSMHLQSALGQLSILYTHIGQGVSSVVRISEVLSQTPLIPTRGGIVLPHIDGNVKFKHVDFTYPTRSNSVLHDLSLELIPGKVVALVGKSGSGKSSIVSVCYFEHEPT
jgi:ABC-type multidrug transport system fused ATPase/permease subunit